MTFQDDPGIAFKETTIQGKHEDREWFYNPQLRRTPCNYPERLLSKRYHGYRRRSKTRPKARSLTEMALKVIVNNLHTTTEDTLANIPLPYLWLIFDECAMNNMLSFHTWKMLSKLLRADRDWDPNKTSPHLNLLSFCGVQIDSPSYELSYYTRHLTCPGTPVDFLTCLHIKPCVFRSDELLALARLNNLLLLEIVDYEEDTQAAASVTDHLVKGWSEMEICFPLLRHLTLESHAISIRSLQYVTKFPSLSVYGVCNPGYDSWSEIQKQCRGIAQDRDWITGMLDRYEPGLHTLCDYVPPVKEPVADIFLRTPSFQYENSRGRVVEFRRNAFPSTSPGVPSPPVEGSPSRPDEPAPRTNIQARKKRKLQDVLSSFEA